MMVIMVTAVIMATALCIHQIILEMIVIMVIAVIMGTALCIHQCILGMMVIMATALCILKTGIILKTRSILKTGIVQDIQRKILMISKVQVTRGTKEIQMK